MFEHSGGGRRGCANGSKLVGTNYAVDKLWITFGVAFEQHRGRVIHRLSPLYPQQVMHRVIHIESHC